MELELVNLSRLQSVSLLAVFRPQVTGAFWVFVLMSIIPASVVPYQFVFVVWTSYLQVKFAM